jgi:DNA-binding winged helix-turn-helix (wHTH) protein
MNGIEYQFLNFRLLPQQALLYRADQVIHLAPKTFGLLSMLVASKNALITREYLIEALWQGRPASDESLARIVAQCRKALGDAATRQTIIQTLPKRGFRLVPEVKIVQQDNPSNDMVRLLSLLSELDDAQLEQIKSLVNSGANMSTQLLSTLRQQEMGFDIKAILELQGLN